MRALTFMIAILLTPALGASVGPEVGSTFDVDISSLHPTQFNVGREEVDQKQADFKKMGPKKLEAYLHSHPCPVVIGPDGTFYITDEQHRANAGVEAEHSPGLHALEKSGHPTMYAKVIDSYPAYLKICESKHREPIPFDKWMVKKNYTFLYDRGVAKSFKDLPTHVNEMGNDSYRSLAGDLERKAYQLKKGVYFAQFKVADWLRAQLKLSDKEIDDLIGDKKFIKRVSHLLRSDEAKKQPWFKGPEYSKDCTSCLLGKIKEMAR